MNINTMLYKISRQLKSDYSKTKAIYRRIDSFIANHTDADDDLRQKVAVSETIKELGGDVHAQMAFR